MKTLFFRLTCVAVLMLSGQLAWALTEEDQQQSTVASTVQPASETASVAADSANEPLQEALDEALEELENEADEADTGVENGLLTDEETNPSGGFRHVLKEKFIEGNAFFMSLVALALVLGLAFCVERIIYLTLSRIRTREFMDAVDAKIAEGDIEGAKALCRDTRGPVASICYQGLLRYAEPAETIERSVASYGNVQVANLEKGCSWIRLFIAMAPSLGFLGTVIGMVMAFDDIQSAGDISPTIVASGIKVALITTIFGIIVALVLQLFYNYIITKIDALTADMEDSAITLLDAIVKKKSEDQP